MAQQILVMGELMALSVVEIELRKSRVVKIFELADYLNDYI